MFTQIKTSKENKQIVSVLTRKLGLGTENIIARIAYTYSLSLDRKLDLNDIQDSLGKEYSKNVLFGELENYYIGLVCVHYQIYKTDKDLPKYIKMHIDDGLKIFNEEIRNMNNVDGFDFLSKIIEKNLLRL